MKTQIAIAIATVLLATVAFAHDHKGDASTNDSVNGMMGQGVNTAVLQGNLRDSNGLDNVEANGALSHGDPTGAGGTSGFGNCTADPTLGGC